MNRSISFKVPTAERRANEASDHPIALWVFVVVLIAVAAAALVGETRMTFEQRIMLLEQSGYSP